MIYVMDAGALIAYLNGEIGDGVVDALLLDTANENYVHVINLCEVFYGYMGKHDETTAESYVQALLTTGLLLREDMDGALWRSAGRLKTTFHLSLADAFGLAFALKIGGTFVTTDRKELDPVDAAGACPILFIR